MGGSQSFPLFPTTSSKNEPFLPCTHCTAARRGLAVGQRLHSAVWRDGLPRYSQALHLASTGETYIEGTPLNRELPVAARGLCDTYAYSTF